MSIQFERYTYVSRFLDPRQGFNEVAIPSEVRRDPLTGDVARVIPGRSFSLPAGLISPLPSEVEDRSRETCPFCPERIADVTPRFLPELIPEGRIQEGTATVLPNIGPYDLHTALTVMTDEHALPMARVHEAVPDAFRASLRFFDRLRAYDPDGAGYQTIAWNYRYQAGGSMLHPHLQLVAGSVPSSMLDRMVAGSTAYLERHGTSYWDDLLATERAEGSRWVSAFGPVHVLATYAPKIHCDVMFIFEGCTTFGDISPEHIDGLTRAVHLVASYYDRQHYPAFNFVLYAAPAGTAGFAVHARMIPRFLIPPFQISDTNFFQILLGDGWSMTTPEDLADALRMVNQEL